jgi:Copper binding proteins, plastocyanin/azurin family
VGTAGRRRAATLVAMALAALAVAAPLSAPAGAAGSGCAWQRHTKRVVRHVRRHGRPAKVVRVKHYWTCNPVLAPETPIPPPLVPPGTPVAPTPAPEPEPQPEPRANAVGVIARDTPTFSYTVLAEEPHTGPLTVQLQNKGEDPHNLNIERIGPGGEPEGEPLAEIEDTAPGAQNTTEVELPPGEYLMFCSLPHHAEKGMKATLVVK